MHVTQLNCYNAPLQVSQWQTCGHRTCQTLDPVDYAIWSVIQQRVYETRVHDMDELRQRLLHVWCSLEQSLIDETVDQWQTRLHDCVRAKGRHFEHTLSLSICFLRT